jgi:hypothetical protein
MTRICLYTRISTDEENQPTLLASQHERLEAFCKVQEDWRIVARLNARLDDLRAQQAELADDGTDEAAHAPTAADLAATANQLEGVIADGEPEQTKALLRILIAELRVNSKTDIKPTYRIITPDRTHTARVYTSNLVFAEMERTVRCANPVVIDAPSLDVS